MSTSESSPESSQESTPSEHHPRMKLILRTLTFQFRLLADGLRDLILSPLSVVASLAGLLIGGSHPERYFNDLMRLGRRTEVRINLFGRYDEPDETLQQWEKRVLQEIEAHAEQNPRLKEMGNVLDRALDRVNALSSDAGRTERPQHNHSQSKGISAESGSAAEDRNPPNSK